MKLKTLLTTVAVASTFAVSAAADNLSLAYFMGSNHPMNKAFLTPMGEMIEAETAGSVTVQHFPGGALNASPPRQYSIMLEGVADIVFMDPSSTSRIFPRTSAISLPNLCETPAECTTLVQGARATIEEEYKGKVIGLWTSSPPVLITRGTPVRSLKDVQGMKIRVTDPTAIPFVEALGASAVAMPVTEVNQALANGIVDAVMIDPSGILSFKLDEPGEYVTSWFAGGPATFAVVMNQSVYDGLSDAEKAAVEKVSRSELSMQAANTYAAIGKKAMEHAAAQGLEIIDFSEEERAKIDAVVAEVMTDVQKQPAGDKTVGDIVALLKGN